MAATKAGQIVFPIKVKPGEQTREYSYWTTDGDNGYSGQIIFKETLLRDYEYYYEYVDENGYSYFDICLKLSSDSTDKKGLIKLQGDEYSASAIDNNKIFKLVFQPFVNTKHSQNFDIVLVNSTSKAELVIKNYNLPISPKADKQILYFSPENFNNSGSDFYDTILFRVNRNSSSKELVMELQSLELYEIENQLDIIRDENDDPIEEFLGLTIETVNRGECQFFINNDVFYVGNDRILNIAEELNLSITKLSYLGFTPNEQAIQELNSNDYITALVNYKY